MAASTSTLSPARSTTARRFSSEYAHWFIIGLGGLFVFATIVFFLFLAGPL